MSPFISPLELVALIDSDKVPVLLDVRWSLARPNGYDDYAQGHLLGAVYVDLETQLSQHGAPELGRHPLPDAESLQQAARNWGITTNSHVVVYDAGNALAAGRAWWLLRYFGLSNVQILSGGLNAWQNAGYAVSREEPTVRAGNVELSPGHLPTLSASEAATLPEQGGILLDARAAERYRGEVEPVDPKAGHIPGALSAPTTGNVDESGEFLDVAQLRSRFYALGITSDTPVGVYCGSGVTAAHQIAAIEAAGFPTPALFPGSWSAWSNQPQRPVAVGAEPGGK